ncbi:MAG: SUMF1/EgtB/PvdO family nonheme iron enzyme, partial [Sphaerospermopsis kisseleviana]
LTRVGTITGTPGYAPPEQFRGIVYPNSDIYSLAVTCIRLLTGHLQKADGSDLLFDSMRMQWVWKQYVSVSKDLEIVLDKMLQDLPINRVQSANDILAALSTQQKSPTIITPQPVNNSSPSQPNSEFISTQQQSAHKSFTENLGNGVVLEMIAIPGGTFLMGSPDAEGYDDEKPQHQVTVPPFYMGKYPVTQAQWERVARLPKVKIDLKPKPSYFKGENLPVEQVSWLDAQEFCARIIKSTGKVYRLPSEAEWEYACRAGTTTPYYISNSLSRDVANYNQWYGQTTNVGKFPPNSFGLYDMHGNVWEWCEDSWHENYRNAPIDGSTWNNQTNEYKILRGGSWHLKPDYCRSARRNSGDACLGFVVLNYGFRVACAVAWT